MHAAHTKVWVYMSCICLGIHFLNQFGYTFLESVCVYISYISLGITFLTLVWIYVSYISLAGVVGWCEGAG